MKLLFVFFLLLLGFIHSNHSQMDIVDKDFLLGKFSPSKHPDFVKVVAPFTLKDDIWLHKDTYEAFKQMHNAAKKEGIQLIIISGTRNFNRQKQIWENKWNGITLVDGKKLNETIPDPKQRAVEILKYSAMPGTSRHHWGTDIDINSVEPSYFMSGKGLKEFNWLLANANKFGFCQTYKMKSSERITGYEDEPWHWSYLPLACKFLDEFVKTVSYNDILGFKGDETAQYIDVINNYVIGIHPDCCCKK